VHPAVAPERSDVVLHGAWLHATGAGDIQLPDEHVDPADVQLRRTANLPERVRADGRTDMGWFPVGRPDLQSSNRYAYGAASAVDPGNVGVRVIFNSGWVLLLHDA
jgi:hypothetical protein